VIADLVTKGGFPPLLLAPVNFDALYAQQAQQQRSLAETVEVRH
jgi:preprotein translocase subunit SecB